MKPVVSALAASLVSGGAFAGATLLALAEAAQSGATDMAAIATGLKDNPLAYLLVGVGFVYSEPGKQLVLQVVRLFAIGVGILERLAADWLEARSPYPRVTSNLDRRKEPAGDDHEHTD